jgi:hypothetical protein
MATTFDTANSALLSSANSIFLGIAQFLPNLIGALVVFIVGLILSNWVKSLTIKLFRLLKLSRITASENVKNFLEQAQITQTIESLLGSIVKSIIILIFSITSINLLGLSTVTQVLNRLLAYIPNIIAAIIILAVGIVIAGIVEKVLKGSLSSIDLKTSRSLAKLASYLVVVMTSLAALSQLGIAESFVNIIFIGFIAMLSIGLGLSLGLGSKDLVGKILEDWYKNIKKDLG